MLQTSAHCRCKEMAKFRQGAHAPVRPYWESLGGLFIQDGSDYETVKLAVLKAYKLVSEAISSNWVKGDKQTNVSMTWTGLKLAELAVSVLF